MLRDAIRFNSRRARPPVGVAGSLANDSLRIDRSHDSRGRQLFEIQKTEKIQRKVHGKTNRFAPYPCPGEVLVRRGRLTNLPEAAAKKNTGRFRWQR
jgi:hypothetical protein